MDEDEDEDDEYLFWEPVWAPSRAERMQRHK